MSSDNKDNAFDALAHEKIISGLYQNNKQHHAEKPSAQIDSRIIATAKLQLSGNPSLLIKDNTLNPQPSKNKEIKTKRQKLWQWPFSFVASVGLLGILFITQRDYFIHPNNIVAGDADMLNAPLMQTPSSSQVARLTEEITAVQSFKVEKAQATTQKSELLFDKDFSAVERKKRSVMQPSVLLKEQTMDKLKFEGDLAKTSAMSLSDMSELAELLKREMSMPNMSALDVSISRLKMQQSLFQGLIQYKQVNKNFKIPEEFLNVLTEKQVQQLIH
jgi:hypothetical protein